MNYLIEKENQKVSVNDCPRFNKNYDSILTKIFDESLWKRNFMLQTEEGYNINDIIQAGIDNPDHSLGLVAVSKDSYYTFDELLINAAKMIHNRNVGLSKNEKENFSVVKSLLNNLEEVLTNSVDEFEITVNRNFEGHSFTSKISRSDRRDLARSAIQIIKSEENEVFDESGKFLVLSDKKEIKNVKEQNPFFNSCGIYRDWPDGRFTYVNNTDSLYIRVNEENHLKIIQKFKGDFNFQYLTNYFDLLERLHNKINFVYDDYLGYLNSLPINLGSATYFIMKLKVPKEKKEIFYNGFKNSTDLQFNELKEDGDNVLIEINNKTSFYHFSQFLIELTAVKDIFL